MTWLLSFLSFNGQDTVKNFTHIKKYNYNNTVKWVIISTIRLTNRIPFRHRWNRTIITEDKIQTVPKDQTRWYLVTLATSWYLRWEVGSFASTLIIRVCKDTEIEFRYLRYRTILRSTTWHGVDWKSRQWSQITSRKNGMLTCLLKREKFSKLWSMHKMLKGTWMSSVFNLNLQVIKPLLEQHGKT